MDYWILFRGWHKLTDYLLVRTSLYRGTFFRSFVSVTRAKTICCGWHQISPLSLSISRGGGAFYQRKRLPNLFTHVLVVVAVALNVDIVWGPSYILFFSCFPLDKSALKNNSIFIDYFPPPSKKKVNLKKNLKINNPFFSFSAGLSESGWCCGCSCRSCSSRSSIQSSNSSPSTTATICTIASSR